MDGKLKEPSFIRAQDPDPGPVQICGSKSGSEGGKTNKAFEI